LKGKKFGSREAVRQAFAQAARTCSGKV